MWVLYDAFPSRDLSRFQWAHPPNQVRISYGYFTNSSSITLHQCLGNLGIFWGGDIESVLLWNSKSLHIGELLLRNHCYFNRLTGVRERNSNPSERDQMVHQTFPSLDASYRSFNLNTFSVHHGLLNVIYLLRLQPCVLMHTAWVISVAVTWGID